MDETSEVEVAPELEARTDLAGAAPDLAAPVSARVFEGRAARIHRRGDALRYKVARTDGTIGWREEHRDESELQRIRSQIVGKPVVLQHPAWSKEHGGMLSRGATGDVVGEIIGARVDGDWVVVRVLVTDDHALQDIEDGVIELSLGYMCKLDASGYQRDTFVDHLAIVERGRCGGTCALRADEARGDCGCESTDAIRHEVPPPPQESLVADQACSCKPLANSLAVGQSASHMPPASDIDAKDQAQMDELQKQLADAQAENAALKARADQAEQAVEEQKKAREAAELEAYNAKKDLESRADAEKAAVEKAVADAESARDAEKARADGLQAELDAYRADADARQQSLVDEKVELLAHVAPLGLKFEDAEGKEISIHRVDSKQIKLAAIKHVDDEDFSSKSNDWIDCAFAGAMKRHRAAAQSRADATQAVAEMRTTGNPNITVPSTGYAAEKRLAAEQAQKLSTAWKTPSTKKDQ